MENIVLRVEQPLRLFGVTMRLGSIRDIGKDVWIPGIELELYHYACFHCHRTRMALIVCLPVEVCSLISQNQLNFHLFSRRIF